MKSNINSYFGNYFVVTFFKIEGLNDTINLIVKLRPSLFNFSEETMELTCKGDVGYVHKKGSQKEYIFIYIYEKAFRGFAEEEIDEIKDIEGKTLWKNFPIKNPIEKAKEMIEQLGGGDFGKMQAERMCNSYIIDKKEWLGKYNETNPELCTTTQQELDWWEEVKKAVKAA